MKESESNTKKCPSQKDIPCSWIQTIWIVQMIQCSRETLRFIGIPIIVPKGLFGELEQRILKCVWKPKQTRRVDTVKERGTSLNLSCSGFQTNYNHRIIKTRQYWHQDIHIDPGNRTESPEVNSHLENQLI